MYKVSKLRPTMDEKTPLLAGNGPTYDVEVKQKKDKREPSLSKVLTSVMLLNLIKISTTMYWISTKLIP